MNLEEMIKKEVDRVFNEEKIKSIVRHEIEERLGKIVWDLEDVVKAAIMNKVAQSINIPEIANEEIIKIVKVKTRDYLNSYDARKVIDENIGKTFQSIKPEIESIIKNEVTKEAIARAKYLVDDFFKKRVEEITFEKVDYIFKRLDEFSNRLMMLERAMIERKA